MFLFLCESHIQMVISLSYYTNRFKNQASRGSYITNNAKFLIHIVIWSTISTDWTCFVHAITVNRDFLYCCHDYFYACIKPVYHWRIHLGQTIINCRWYHSPRCPQNGDCLHAIPSGSVWLMLSVFNVDHEIINAIISENAWYTGMSHTRDN